MESRTIDQGEMSNDQRLEPGVSGEETPRQPDLPKRPASEFMGKFVEVELTDGRLISGIIVCTDREANFILSAADERWERDDLPRRLGMVMLARRHVKRILMITLPEENQNQESQSKVSSV